MPPRPRSAAEDMQLWNLVRLWLWSVEDWRAPVRLKSTSARRRKSVECSVTDRLSQRRRKHSLACSSQEEDHTAQAQRVCRKMFDECGQKSEFGTARLRKVHQLSAKARSGLLLPLS